ncbi:hypothetical protein ACF0H5_010138 [Mactra antiquata]
MLNSFRHQLENSIGLPRQNNYIQEVELVRDHERRFVQAQPVPAPIQQDLPQPDPPIQREENQVDVAPPPVDDAAEEARARQAPRHDRRDHTAANLSSSDDDEDQPPRRRSRFADLIRENNELYNSFMRRTVPRILAEFGIDID